MRATTIVSSFLLTSLAVAAPAAIKAREDLVAFVESTADSALKTVTTAANTRRADVVGADTVTDALDTVTTTTGTNSVTGLTNGLTDTSDLTSLTALDSTVGGLLRRQLSGLDVDDLLVTVTDTLQEVLSEVTALDALVGQLLSQTGSATSDLATVEQELTSLLAAVQGLVKSLGVNVDLSSVSTLLSTTISEVESLVASVTQLVSGTNAPNTSVITSLVSEIESLLKGINL